MPRRFLTSPSPVGAIVRAARLHARISQAELAQRAGVGRRFVVDVEAGHPRAELGKVLTLLDALDVFPVVGEVSPIAHRMDLDHRDGPRGSGRPQSRQTARTPLTVPSARVLHAFAGRRAVGHFRLAEGQVRFAYDPSAGPTPVSLSLPRHGAHAAGAALDYLDRLLPEPTAVRQRWARERGLPGWDPMTLLSAYGEDLVGALSLSPDPELPARDPVPLVEVTREDIAARIAALRNQSTAWLDQRARPRVSLGGSAGKFTLTRLGGRWFWPTYESPSTHVFKVVPHPAGPAVATFLGQQVLLRRRWDRLDGLRIHAERLPDGTDVLLAGVRITPVASP